MGILREKDDCRWVRRGMAAMEYALRGGRHAGFVVDSESHRDAKHINPVSGASQSFQERRMDAAGAVEFGLQIDCFDGSQFPSLYSHMSARLCATNNSSITF